MMLDSANQFSFEDKIIRQEQNSISKRSHFLFPCNVDPFVRAKLKSRWGQLKKWLLYHLKTKSSDKNITASRNDPFCFLFTMQMQCPRCCFRAKLKSKWGHSLPNVSQWVNNFSLANKIIIYFQRGQQRRNYFWAKLKWSQSPPPHARAAL